MKIISKLYALEHNLLVWYLLWQAEDFHLLNILIFFKKAGITTINAAANAHGYALDLGIAEFWWHLITSIWGKEAGSQENIIVCFQKTWYF